MKEVNVLYEFKSFKKYRSENKTEKAGSEGGSRVVNSWGVSIRGPGTMMSLAFGSKSQENGKL